MRYKTFIIVVLAMIVNIRIAYLSRAFPNPLIEEKYMNEIMKIEDIDLSVKKVKIIDSKSDVIPQDVIDYINEIGNSAKLILVFVYIDNASSNNQEMALYEYALQNEIWSDGIPRELLYYYNDSDIDLIFNVKAGEKKKIVIPFIMYDFQVKENQWKNLDSNKFQLVITKYPIKRTILMRRKV